MGVDVPEAAGIRGNLVCEDNLAVGGLAEFDLEVDEVNADALEELQHELVDLQSHRADLINLLLRCKAGSEDMVIVDHRVAEIVVLVAELQDRYAHGG